MHNYTVQRRPKLRKTTLTVFDRFGYVVFVGSRRRDITASSLRHPDLKTA